MPRSSDCLRLILMRHTWHRRRALAFVTLAVSLLCAGSASLVQSAQNTANQDPWVTRIRVEALSASSQVMTYAFYLSDVYGPRFSGSPGFRAAAGWARDQLARLGLHGVRLDPLKPWGYTEPGWSFTYSSVRLLEPQEASLVALPTATSPSTPGPVSGEPVFFDLPGRSGLSVDAIIERYRGTLRGKILLVSRDPVRLGIPTTAPFQRLTDAELRAARQPPAPSPPPPPVAETPRPAQPERTPQQELEDFKKLFAFLRDEGALAYLSPAPGEGGTVLATRGLGPIGLEPPPPPGFTLPAESYNRILRLLEHRIPVRIEVDLRSTFHDADGHVNVLSELTGTTRQQEIVLVGAHLDSWQGGTGATDNAAGCAVLMEALRILKVLDVPLARTVRIALWGGEERGTWGSRAYVQEYQQQKTESLVVYFNLDGNGGRIRGLRVQGREDLAPLAERWLAAFRDDNDGYVSVRKTLGSDQFSFDQAGLTNMVFITDPAWSARTYHSSMDVYDYLIPDDLKRSSALVAAVLYRAANEP